MTYLLGIDIGTSNTKALAYTTDGRTIASANRSYTTSSEEEGWYELDPAMLYNAVTDVIRTVATKLRSVKPAAICFSSAMHGLIAVGRNGTPLTHMITWADLRSAEFAKELNKSPRAKHIYEKTGTPIHPMSPLCKLIWLKNKRPKIFEQAYKFISIKEYVFYQFFGRYLIDHSIASATGLFNIHDQIWDTEALDTAGIDRDRLSVPVPSLYTIRGLKSDMASTLGIDADTPFVIGASDGCLAHIGSNALREGDVSLTIGTSGAIRIMNKKPYDDPERRIFNYLLTDDLYISGGAINNGGNVLKWFTGNFLQKPLLSNDDMEDFINQALSTEPGAGGLVFLPYIYGERAPVWDAEAKGIFFGIDASHTLAHFMRAVLEGICFALLGILDAVEEISGPAKNIYASGGFIRSEKWLELMADILGKKLIVVQEGDSSACGAAIIGMKALRIIDNLADSAAFFTTPGTYEPDMARHRIYMENYKVYSGLYHCFKDIKK